MNPQTFNRYSYVYNRPIIMIDPSGHIGCFTDFAGSCENTNAGPVLEGPIDGEVFAHFGQYAPGAGTYDDVTTFATGCGLVCQAGDEELVGPVWRGVSGVAIIAPFSGAAVRNTVEGIGTFFKRNGEEILQFANRLMKGCAFNSFEAGTMVETIDGPKPIEEIAIGDLVLAYNEATEEIGYYPVTDLISHLDLQVVYLTIDGETIVTTAEHPFYTADGEWVDAGELKAGDAIRTSDWTTGEVTWVQTVAQPQQMYNFTVATAHTYFVGDGEWLVHNINCPTPASVVDSLSRRNRKHIERHLGEFQQYDPNFTLESQITLGASIIKPENLTSAANASQRTYEGFVEIEGQTVRIKSVLNRSDKLRSVYIIGP